MSTSYDVVVVGGGPAGSTAALSLVRAGRSVAMLEHSDYTGPRVGETLTPAVKASLTRLGLWNAFLRLSPASSPAIHSAWGSDSLREQNHFYNPYGPGWHIDRRRFDMMLAFEARDAGANVITLAQILSLKSNDSRGWTVGFCTGPTRSLFSARVVLDATGRFSVVARRLGIRRIVSDNLVGVLGFFAQALKENLPQVTLIEAVEDGWWYSASLPDSRLVVAWMTDADLYSRGGRHSAAKWLEHLGRTVQTQDRMKGAGLISRPLIVQANTSRLDRVHGHNWLAVGDAAIAFDPIAGQGVYEALESGNRAAEAIEAFLGGQSGDFTSYASRHIDSFNQFLVLRRKYYSREMRWPSSSFWSRRQTSFGHFAYDDTATLIPVNMKADPDGNENRIQRTERTQRTQLVPP